MPAPTVKSQLRKGSALIEFSLSTLVWVPLLLGTIFIGINMTRAIEVTQICRDAGHMHAYGIDFSQPANQQILVRLASDFTFSTTGGNGVIILSTITFVSQQDCAAAGLPNCANVNQCAFTRRIVIGNSTLRTSAFGTPPAGTVDSGGNINQTYYLNNAGTRATGFSSLLPLQEGQYAYVSEAYFTSPDLNWSGFTTGSASYARAIF